MASDTPRVSEAHYKHGFSVKFMDEMKDMERELAAITAERDDAMQKSENILQMVSDRISQLKSDCEGVSDDDIRKAIAEVSAATGNKCDDDSIWFAGKEWQKFMCPEEAEELRGQLAAAHDALRKLCEEYERQCRYIDGMEIVVKQGLIRELELVAIRKVIEQASRSREVIKEALSAIAQEVRP